MTTAFYSHPECRGHDMGRGHPECPQRLDAIDDYLLASGVDVALERRELARIVLVHLEIKIAAIEGDRFVNVMNDVSY